MTGSVCSAGVIPPVVGLVTVATFLTRPARASASVTTCVPVQVRTWPTSIGWSWAGLQARSGSIGSLIVASSSGTSQVLVRVIAWVSVSPTEATPSPLASASEAVLTRRALGLGLVITVSSSPGSSGRPAR